MCATVNRGEEGFVCDLVLRPERTEFTFEGQYAASVRVEAETVHDWVSRPEFNSHGYVQDAHFPPGTPVSQLDRHGATHKSMLGSLAAANSFNLSRPSTPRFQQDPLGNQVRVRTPKQPIAPSRSSKRRQDHPSILLRAQAKTRLPAERRPAPFAPAVTSCHSGIVVGRGWCS